MTFAGGHSYNQVGISGELLTDWGNIRSNGYIPVGTTGESTGKYVSRNILCVQGINAALGGADFELGAYLLWAVRLGRGNQRRRLHLRKYPIPTRYGCRSRPMVRWCVYLDMTRQLI